MIDRSNSDNVIVQCTAIVFDGRKRICNSHAKGQHATQNYTFALYLSVVWICCQSKWYSCKIPRNILHLCTGVPGCPRVKNKENIYLQMCIWEWRQVQLKFGSQILPTTKVKVSCTQSYQLHESVCVVITIACIVPFASIRLISVQ